jgi:hypothetical protein
MSIAGVDIVLLGIEGAELRRVCLNQVASIQSTEGDEGQAFKAIVQIGDLQSCIKSVQFESSDLSVEVERSPEYELDSLFFETDAEFERSQVGKRRRARPRDKETDCFFSRQMAEAFSGSVEARLLMAISFCYRAVELGSNVEMAHAVELLDCYRDDLNLLSDSTRFRRDRTHLSISMLTAKWHAELALGRYEQFRFTLEEILKMLPLVVASPAVFAICYNAVRSLSILGMYCASLREHGAALNAFLAARNVLKAGAENLGDGELLDEFATNCRIVAATASLRKTLKQADTGIEMSSFNARITEKKILRPCIRTANVQKMIECFGRAVSAGTST